MEIANIQKNQLVTFQPISAKQSISEKRNSSLVKEKPHPFPREILHLKSQWANINQIKIGTNYP